MVSTILLSIAVTAINQVTKLLMRFLGVTKKVATIILFLVGFIFCFLYTYMMSTGMLTKEIIASIVTMFMSSVGMYQLFINKSGLDDWMKDALELERG